MVASFDPVAPYYDFLARLFFGQAILKSQTEYLNQVPRGSTILIFGGGTGMILEAVMEREPDRITYLDASPKMIRQARAKLKDQTNCRVDFLVGTEYDLPATHDFDVVITPFVLDVFQAEGLKFCMSRIAQCLKKDGLWLFSDFRVSDQPFHRIWQSILVNLMYGFFKITCRIEGDQLLVFDEYFKRMGYQEGWSKYYYRGFIQAKAFKRE